MIITFQHLHLLDGNLVESNKSFFLRHSLIDKYGLNILIVPNSVQLK